MTPELSRQLAQLANKYDGRKDADFDLCIEFRHFVRQHEDDINMLDDIPAKYKPIIDQATKTN